MSPRMIIVAGPPGGGKSTAFPVSGFGVAYFNADDRAAMLNGGSYSRISSEIRKRVNQEFEAFVQQRIASRDSLAIETTLRSGVTFDQARAAKNRGFHVEMRYIALASFGLHVERVKARADAGGHSASENTLRRIYDASVGNLQRALRNMDRLWVYDNSHAEPGRLLVLRAEGGVIRFVADHPPAWLTAAIR